jgi:hypothetical protein
MLDPSKVRNGWLVALGGPATKSPFGQDPKFSQWRTAAMRIGRSTTFD